MPGTASGASARSTAGRSSTHTGYRTNAGSAPSGTDWRPDAALGGETAVDPRDRPAVGELPSSCRELLQADGGLAVAEALLVARGRSRGSSSPGRARQRWRSPTSSYAARLWRWTRGSVARGT